MATFGENMSSYGPLGGPVAAAMDIVFRGALGVGAFTARQVGDAALSFTRGFFGNPAMFGSPRPFSSAAGTFTGPITPMPNFGAYASQSWQRARYFTEGAWRGGVASPRSWFDWMRTGRAAGAASPLSGMPPITGAPSVTSAPGNIREFVSQAYQSTRERAASYGVASGFSPSAWRNWISGSVGGRPGFFSNAGNATSRFAGSALRWATVGIPVTTPAGGVATASALALGINVVRDLSLGWGPSLIPRSNLLKGAAAIVAAGGVRAIAEEGILLHSGPMQQVVGNPAVAGSGDRRRQQMMIEAQQRLEQSTMGLTIALSNSARGAVGR